jgi:nonribosomal peptide synthetase DhbF/fengycin family lipopeptide synthetase D
LRTRFISEGGLPRQVIEPIFRARLKIHREWDGVSEELLKAVLANFAGHACTGFALDALPLFSLHLYVLAPDEYLLGVVVHHIVSDGVSMQVMLDDLIRFYNGKSKPPRHSIWGLLSYAGSQGMESSDPTWLIGSSNTPLPKPLLLTTSRGLGANLQRGNGTPRGTQYY